MRIALAVILSALLASAGTYLAVNPMRSTGLEQHAIVATFIEAYCKGRPGDAFNAGASAALSVVAQRAGLGAMATVEAAKCIVMPPPTPEFLADLAKAKFETEQRKKGFVK